MNYDPDRSLWLPSRRKFFFLGLAAGIAPFLPDVPRCVLVPQINPASATEILQSYQHVIWFPHVDPLVTLYARA